MKRTRELQIQPPAPGGPSRHSSTEDGPPTDLWGYVSVILRRKWIILPLVIVMPLAAYLHESFGTAKYEASAQVLLTRQSASLSGLNDPLILQPERMIRTQADIARLPAIAQRVVNAARGGGDANTFLNQSAVDSNDQIDVLTFRVQDAEWNVATSLANLYARKYIEYRRQLDTNALREALQTVKAQITTLERRGLSVNSTLYAAFAEKQQQLEAALTLQKSNALLVRLATPSSTHQVEPRPLRIGIFAVTVSILLALGLAFLVDTLDTRIRRPEQLADELGLPLLGGLPAPPAGRPQVVMLEEPNSPSAELFRMLRTSLEVTALADGCKSIMVTSAFEAEGKSTTAANLAVALARTGKHVMLLDMDLRQPSLNRYFDLKGKPGITDIAKGRASVEEAAVRLTFDDAFEHPFRATRFSDRLVAEQGKGRTRGILDVVGPGTPLQNPGEFVSSQIDATLDQLQASVDLIVVDGPPLLLAGDALTLSSKVDALLLVARMKALKRGQVGELARVLAASPAMKLGLVATGDSAVQRRTYYGISAYGQPAAGGVPSHLGSSRYERPIPLASEFGPDMKPTSASSIIREDKPVDSDGRSPGDDIAAQESYGPRARRN